MVLLTVALASQACGVPTEKPPPRYLEETTLVPDLVLDGPELYKPTSVAVDGGGRIHVLDAGNYRLNTYSSSGKLMAQRGRRGEGPEEFPLLQEGQSEVAVRDSTAVVMMPGPQRLLVWDLSMEVASTFRVGARPRSLAFDGSTIYLTVDSAGAPDVTGSVSAYSLDGTLLAEFGERFRPEWNDPSTHRLVRLQNWSMIAVSPRGLLFEIGRWWPWLRAYSERAQRWEKWLDFSWLSNPARREFFGRPRTELAELSFAAIQEDRSKSSPRIFDLAASDQAVFALLGTSGNVQVFNHDGSPTANYRLFPADVDPEAAADLKPLPTPQAMAFGVNPDGSRLCTASFHTARVLCYDLDLGG
ncbi:MAG TPA: hypothetical protein VGD06_00345 [Acidobacteriota bacterium]